MIIHRLESIKLNDFQKVFAYHILELDLYTLTGAVPDQYHRFSTSSNDSQLAQKSNSQSVTKHTPAISKPEMFYKCLAAIDLSLKYSAAYMNMYHGKSGEFEMNTENKTELAISDYRKCLKEHFNYYDYSEVKGRLSRLYANVHNNDTKKGTLSTGIYSTSINRLRKDLTRVIKKTATN